MTFDPQLSRELQSIRAEHAPSFRAGTLDLQQRWLDSIFSEAGVDAEPEMDDTLSDLFGVISSDTELLKLYIAVSFGTAAAEGIRRHMERERANGVLEASLRVLAAAKTQKEILSAAREFHRRMHESYVQSAREAYSPLVRDAVEIIWFRRFHPLSSSDVAAELSVERTSLAHRFKRETGKTLTEYILSVKMEEARRMRSRNVPLTEISDALGFSTYAYFSRKYRNYFGNSPQNDK